MAAPAIPTMTMLGAVTTCVISGRRYAIIPTGSATSRGGLNRLSINDEELTALQRQSSNIFLRVFAHEDIDRLCTSIIRFPNRFRALIIASRGEVVAKCTNECTNPSTTRFQSCIVIPGFEGGACAECVWNSDGHNCEHNPDSQLSSLNDDESDA